MKFYIVEDDMSIVKIIENIIEDYNLGEVLGYSLNGNDGVDEILSKRPDIVLVDLLMPDKDGIELVKDVRKSLEDIKFIMISQVSSKDLIGKAYNHGIEFFISKPINIIEVVNVVKNVSDKLKMEKTLNNIKATFENLDLNKRQFKGTNKLQNIRLVLSKIGIIGEKGAQDILDICKYLIDEKENSLNYKINEICNMLSSNPKAMEQRIRRAINKALVNLANLGIEDYMNDNFVRFSNSLFNFEDVKSEMDYIRGKKSTGGKISVKKFIDGLMFYSEMDLR
ncbi:response regulator [Thermohalobacter berrensis]|uniref:Response regulatory domain-containing protein n=1 Tax=Thermohalobacter berrensis TaxID=99594 RepID=A0A419TA48_9FIRM|nr:response regulator [Thermohalobacter berrensis]RKD34343.1 hypothetical protein BET03_00480 [Thermohalobacter berrensis]